jgi:two-component system phosphate regulon sensor histidine kinase PhoR
MNTESRVRRLLEELHDVRDAATSLPDALVLLDVHGGVRWCNRSAERLLALAWPRDRGVILASRYAGHKLGDWLGGGGAEPVEDVPAPADTTMHLQVTLMPYGHDQRLLLARDISRLARLEQVRRDFVANVSHELRTPLTVIHGYLELLDPEDVPALAPVLDEMRAQSQRMRQIVEDLLALSRLEMERRLPEERVAMQPLLLTLRHEAEALSQGRHRITLEDEAHCDLLGSAKDLHSAFGNLVSNAVRYTPDDGAVTIRWRRTAAGAEYSVADTGYGIPAEHLSRLTERFYRVSSSRSRGSGGTGLGLSIVKHVLNLHGAELRIESEAGVGSTFTCVFDRSYLLACA